MSYESTRLSFNPALYYRLDMVGPADNGDEIPDLSGNELHGTLGYAAGTAGGPGVSPGDGIVPFQEPYGHSSPIETDAASREFCGHNFNTGADTETSRIYRASDPLIEPSGDFTLDAWIRPLRSDMGLAFNGTTGQQLVFKVNSCGIYIDTFTHLAGFCFDSAGGFWKVVCPDEFVISESYYVAVVRLANTLALYVNGELRDLTNITSGLPTRDTGEEFRVHPSQISPADCRYDEAAFQLNALSSGSVLTIYESALAASLLTATSNVIPTAILYSDIEPDPVSFAFRHNWVGSLIERISFRTAISTAVKGYEAANGQRPMPRRELEFSQVLRDNDERQSFRAKLTANQKSKWFIPILEDREWLTAPLAAGSTVMPADPQYRDYEVGSWVELRQLNALDQVIKQGHAQITSLSPLTTTAIVNSYDAGSSISPARRGILEAQISPRGHTDAVEEVSLAIRLVAEDEKVIPNRITPWMPTITYRSYEAFDPAVWQSNDWSELRDYSVEQPRNDVDFDTGSFSPESDQIASYETFSYRMLLEGRALHAALLGWFYARAGSRNYLWAPTMQRDFNIVSVAGSNLTVEKHNYSDNFAGSEFRRDLAFIYNDNSMILRRISSVALAGANEVLALDGSVPSLTSLRSVSYLRFCRLDGDTLEIARVTDTKAYFAWGFREMLSSPA